MYRNDDSGMKDEKATGEETGQVSETTRSTTDVST
jgi:hypothetical protein